MNWYNDLCLKRNILLFEVSYVLIFFLIIFCSSVAIFCCHRLQGFSVVILLPYLSAISARCRETPDFQAAIRLNTVENYRFLLYDRYRKFRLKFQKCVGHFLFYIS